MKKRILAATAVLAMLAAAVTLFGCGPSRKRGEVAKLSALTVEAEDAGQFRILQLTDLHLTKGSSLKKDKETLRWVSDSVDYANPDLVVVTGDAVGGAYGRDDAIVELANLLESKKTYWAYVFGNHDGEWSEETKTQLDPSDITGRLEIIDILKAYEYCLTVRGDETIDGVGNFTVDLVDDTPVSPKLLFTLAFADSGGKIYDADGKDTGKYQGLGLNQVKWYEKVMNEKTAKGAEGGVYAGSALFMHVPPTEFQSAYTDTALPYIGNFPIIVNESHCYGQAESANEAIKAANDGKGIFDAIKAAGTSLVANGHDHNFNWLKNYEGVLFSYGRCSGVNAWERTAPVGATIYDIDLTASYDVNAPSGAAYTNGLYTVSVIEPEFSYSSYFH